MKPHSDEAALMSRRSAAMVFCAVGVAIFGAHSSLARPLSDIIQYRDLNHNGRRDVYEDSRQPIAARVDDLVSQMTLEEKVGVMLHGVLATPDNPVGISNTGYDFKRIGSMIVNAHVNSMISRLTLPPAQLAEANNAVQRIAEGSRLGIPVTISTDPRNHFQVVPGASTGGGGFTTWPELLGFAALRDPKQVRSFARITAHEYRAVGIQMALSPQADLLTEPRWPRGTGTFGSDPATVSKLAGAYVEGFQGGGRGLTPDGVATVVKHWVGYGAEPSGFDAHNQYGRIVRLTDSELSLHVAAFAGAFRAHVAGVMPAYTIVSGPSADGVALEMVGAGYNKQLNTLLRRANGFQGVVLSDWAITNDCPRQCEAPTSSDPQTPSTIGMPWGVERLSSVERFAKGANAGIDQFGGVDDPADLLTAVRSGLVPIQRVDEAIRRVLTTKFALGLFDNPYVSSQRASSIVGAAASRRKAEKVQRAALVLLQNKRALIPVPASRRVWVYGFSTEAVMSKGLTLVSRAEEADIALVRVATPHQQLHPNHFFGAQQHEGRLDFNDGDPDYEAIKTATRAKSTIIAVDLDRPAILTNVTSKATSVIGIFGATDSAVLDVILGRAVARGRLPVELPSSMNAVEHQNPAVPDDSADPLFRRGAGLVQRSSRTQSRAPRRAN